MNWQRTYFLRLRFHAMLQALNGPYKNQEDKSADTMYICLTFGSGSLQFFCIQYCLNPRDNYSWATEPWRSHKDKKKIWKVPQWIFNVKQVVNLKYSATNWKSRAQNWTEFTVLGPSALQRLNFKTKYFLLSRPLLNCRLWISGTRHYSYSLYR